MCTRCEVRNFAWHRTRSSGVDSASILRFSFGPGSDPESKICEKTDPDPEPLFQFGSSRSLCGGYGQIMVGWMIVAGVWTRVGFSNLKNSRTRIKKFWNRSGVGVWKSDSGNLWYVSTLSGTAGRQLRWDRIRCQAKFLTCEISDFTPCTHAQSNILHTKYVEWILVLWNSCLGKYVGLGIGWEKEK